MIAPPPIPNSPARSPETTPPEMMAAASSASSDHGIPVSTSSRDVRGFGAGVHHESGCIAQKLGAHDGPHRMRRNVAAEGARAGHALEQPEHMAGHRMQPRAAREFALDVRKKRLDRGLGRRRRRGRAIDERIDLEQAPRLLIRSAAHHHTVDMVEMLRGIFDAADPAIDRDIELRPSALQPIHAIVIERWDIAVLARRESVEPGLARVNDERVDTCRDHIAGQRVERLLRVLLVNPDAALHRDRHSHGGLHRGHALTHELRLRHQAGAEAPLLHAVGGAADIEVDLVIANVGADACALGERVRVRATELDGYRMFGRIEGEQALAVSAQHRAGRDHLGVEERAAREQTMEEPAMPVRPFHHRRDRKAVRALQAMLHRAVLSAHSRGVNINRNHGSCRANADAIAYIALASTTPGIGRMQPVISVSDLTKTYASGFRALKGINLDIARGEIFALLGPNGAGKTTLINIICGIVNPTSGAVLVGGHHFTKDYRAARSLIGLVPQELHTDAFESVWATVSFSRLLFGKKPNPAFIEKVLRDLTLWDKKDSKIVTLSGGMKRRVMIAKALSHEPQILFLDEPTAGVDVTLRQDMWNLVRTLRNSGVTIILTTHYIEEAEEMADRIGVINGGELILVEEKAALMRKLGKKQLTLHLQQRLDAVPDALISDRLSLANNGMDLVYTYDTQAERTGITALLQELTRAGIRFRDIETTQSSLEDIFVDLVRQDR